MVEGWAQSQAVKYPDEAREGPGTNTGGSRIICLPFFSLFILTGGL